MEKKEKKEKQTHMVIFTDRIAMNYIMILFDTHSAL
jgi:hypothetical protein